MPEPALAVLRNEPERPATQPPLPSLVAPARIDRPVPAGDSLVLSVSAREEL
jgi:hypothetical protein